MYGLNSSLSFDADSSTIQVSSNSSSNVLAYESKAGISSLRLDDKRVYVRDDANIENNEQKFSGPFGDECFLYNDNGQLEAHAFHGKEHVYEYDDVGRLTKVSGTITECYEYDGFGNVLEAVKDGVTLEYTYENPYDSNQMSSAGGVPLIYDDYGNLVEYDSAKYKWMGGSFLVKADVGDDELNFGYYPDGLRSYKSSGSKGYTEYVYLDAKLIASYSQKYGTIHYHYDDNGELLGLNFNDQLFYYVHDPLGNICGIVDGNGEYVVSYTYSTWGIPQIDINENENLAEANEIVYKDNVYDWETGLYYLNSRYYSPKLMRFISRDDLERISTDGLNDVCYNLYAYCLNNPISMSDPSGCATFGVCLFVCGVAVQFAAVLLWLACVKYLIQSIPPVYVSSGVIDKTKWELKDFVDKSIEDLKRATLAYFALAWCFWKARKGHNKEKHHIIAKVHPKALPARDIWKNKCGMNIDDNPNIVLLKYELHKHIHTMFYFEIINYLIGRTWNSSNDANCVVAILGVINVILEEVSDNAPF